MEKNAFSVSAAVLANEPVGTRYHRLVLQAPEIAGRVEPGQFVNLRVTQTLEPPGMRPQLISQMKGTMPAGPTF